MLISADAERRNEVTHRLDSSSYGTDLRMETAPWSDQEAAEQQHRESP
ncbi:hypothetical protein [Sphingobium fuliginis]|nr:hypothetical protein [Sphingobium fuliginis]